MGDVLTLIEKRRRRLMKKRPPNLKKNCEKNQFTLDDFRDQMTQIRKMGSMGDILKMIPGMGKLKQLKNLEVDEKEFVRIESHHQFHDTPGTTAAYDYQWKSSPENCHRQRNPSARR
jgi:signal recognition particle GTPase